MTYKLEGNRRVEAHPVAQVFPLLREDDRSVLADDIKTHGQRLSVILQRSPSGVDLVLDGRNRLLACEEAGIEPKCYHVEPDTDASSLILSANVFRRHQSGSQRAMSAARVANLPKGRPALTAAIEAISQSTAAGMLKVSRGAVQRATAVLKDPILTAAVDDGHVTVGDAYAIREESESAKRRALAAVASGEARTLRAALAREAPGTPKGEVASEDPAARRPARPSISSVSDSADMIEPPDTSAPSEPVCDSRTETEPVETSFKGSEEHRPASPSESSSPLPLAALANRSDAIEPPEGAEPVDELRGTDASPDSPPLLPTANDVPGGEASDVNAREVNDAMAARTDDGPDFDIRRCMEELRAAAEHLGSVSGILNRSRFRAACHLVRTLASAMDQCLDARMDESVLVAGLPGHVVSSLDAQLASELGHEHSSRTSKERVGADIGEPAVPPSTSAQRKPRTWLPWSRRAPGP